MDQETEIFEKMWNTFPKQCVFPYSENLSLRQSSQNSRIVNYTRNFKTGISDKDHITNFVVGEFIQKKIFKLGGREVGG